MTARPRSARIVPSLVAGDLQLAVGVAGVIGGGEVLAAVLDPFDRPAGQARRERNEEILGIEFAARAEAAAHVVLHHADGAFRQAYLFRQHAPIEEGDLGCAMDRQLTLRGVPFRQQPARLHRHRAVALDRESLATDIGRAREGGVRIAAHAGERHREIAAGSLEQQHVIAARPGAVHDRGQSLDVEHDRVERVLGGGRAVRQHERNGLADIADLAMGDHRLLERREGRRGFLPQRNGRDRGAQRSGDLRRGDHGLHPWPRACGTGLDRADAPVRDRAAQDHGVQQVVAYEVVDVFAAPAQQAKILDAFDRAADEGVAHRLVLLIRLAPA